MVKDIRLPSLFQTTLTLGAFLGLTTAFTTVLGLPVQLALFTGWFMVIILGIYLGHNYYKLERAACRGIYEGMGAVLILLAVGILTGTWISGGIVPTIIYYGLKIINPALFLPITMLICSITALATGTSWGAAGTAGIAMMGVGQGLGIPAPITAGAVLSGVYFGDKMSPLSDSVVLAAGMSGVDITNHIRGMMPVSTISYAITLTLFTVAGFNYGSGIDLQQVNLVVHALSHHFNISFLNLLPVALVLFLLAKRKPSFPVISFGALLGIVWAIVFQGMDITAAINSSWSLPAPDTGMPVLDKLLGGGGMESMLNSLVVIVFGLGFGGLLGHIGIISMLARKLEQMIHNEGRLTGCTIFTAFMGNVLGSGMYVSLILTPRLLRDTYDRLGADRILLSRNSEFGGTLTSGMVPWSDNGIFMAGLLGLSTFEYLPYMWLSFTCILTAIITSYLKPSFTILERGHPEKNLKTPMVEQSGSSLGS